MARASTETPFALVDREDLLPLCPHCGTEIYEVYRKGTGVALGQGRTTVFFCSQCHKALGFSTGRMI
ncbi:MAG: hypothetical protein HKN80_11015 [Acidimicrobiia bacterium]|nr:hypothetical protein [Acidimicrobiia bacterium]